VNNADGEVNNVDEKVSNADEKVNNADEEVNIADEEVNNANEEVNSVEEDVNNEPEKVNSNENDARNTACFSEELDDANSMEVENNVELLASESQSAFSDLGMNDFELDYGMGNAYAEEDKDDNSRVNELEILNRQSLRTPEPVDAPHARVSCGVQVTFSEERQEVTMSCSEASTTCSQTSNASTVYLLKNIQRVGVSENKCMICKSSERRCRVPRKAMWQVWSEKQIVIPNGKRTCNRHLINSRFTKEALDSITASKDGVEMTGTELGQWILEVTTSCKSSKPMFQFIDDSMDSKTYKKLFGLTKDQFNDLYKKYIEPTVMRDTKCRSKREALAMFLIMIRKNMDQETIGFLFHCSQSVVSDSITAVSDTLIKSLVVEHLRY